jgi:predicted transcriptional regulator
MTTSGHTSSFAFLAPYGPLYLQLATVAESALALDPSLTLLKLRQLAEAFAQRAASSAGLAEVGRDANQHDLLRMLRRGREPQRADTPTSARKSNGHNTSASRDDSLDLIVAALQQGEPHLTAADIAEATNLDAPAVKQVLKSLVNAGQVRVHGKARGTSYEWIA